MEEPVEAARLESRQIRSLTRPSCDQEGKLTVPEGPVLTLPRKASSQVKVPVPETDTGRQEENSKARGRTLVKELGNMTP